MWFKDEEKDVIKYYLLPVIKFYTIKHLDFIKQYLSDNYHTYSEYITKYIIPEKVLIEYIKMEFLKKKE